MKYLTTEEAAQRLGYDSDASIRKLIQRKQLKAEKIGGVWAIREEELGKIKRKRKRYSKRKTS
jgi:excisionase family DNA binding protein